MLHKDITQKVIDAAHTVHDALGQGFNRDVYLRALIIELGNGAVNCVTDSEHPIIYRDQAVGTAKIELLVEDKVMVYVTDEQKVSPEAYTEARCLMLARDVPLGLIVCFGAKRVDVRRVELPVRANSKERTPTGRIR